MTDEHGEQKTFLYFLGDIDKSRESTLLKVEVPGLVQNFSFCAECLHRYTPFSFFFFKYSQKGPEHNFKVKRLFCLRMNSKVAPVLPSACFIDTKEHVLPYNLSLNSFRFSKASYYRSDVDWQIHLLYHSSLSSFFFCLLFYMSLGVRSLLNPRMEHFPVFPEFCLFF